MKRRLRQFLSWRQKWRIVDTSRVLAVVLLPIYCKHEIIDGEAVTSYFYHYQGKVIWGVTARILNQFLDIYSQVMEGAEE